MSIKTIVSLSHEIESSETNEMTEDVLYRIREITEDMQRWAESGTKMVQSRMNEKDFVRFLDMIQTAITGAMAVTGIPALALVDLSGDLQPYTQTVVLSVIGALYEEGII